MRSPVPSGRFALVAVISGGRQVQCGRDDAAPGIAFVDGDGKLGALHLGAILNRTFAVPGFQPLEHRRLGKLVIEELVGFPFLSHIDARQRADLVYALGLLAAGIVAGDLRRRA